MLIVTRRIAYMGVFAPRRRPWWNNHDARTDGDLYEIRL